MGNGLLNIRQAVQAVERLPLRPPPLRSLEIASPRARRLIVSHAENADPLSNGAEQVSMSHGHQIVTASDGSTLLNTAQLERAIRSNRRWSERLRWNRFYVPISLYYLRFVSQAPLKDAFAQAVARWQQAVGLRVVDGVLGPQTWRLMRSRGEPHRYVLRTPSGLLHRPSNYRELVRTFAGRSTAKEHLERQMVKMFAPSDREFELVVGVRRNYVLGHRYLKRHFETLFQTISDAGLWSELLPVGGPYTYRLKRGGKSLSTHAFGIAIDVNPSTYPQGQSQKYPPPELVRIFQAHGFHWGIFFSNPDPHHFQFATGI